MVYVRFWLCIHASDLLRGVIFGLVRGVVAELSLAPRTKLPLCACGEDEEDEEDDEEEEE